MAQDICVDRVFAGRTRNSWSERPVEVSTIRQLYDLLKLGPTSLNTSPARFRFLVSDEAKERLSPHLMAGNRGKAMSAPCVVIIAYDTAFFDKLPTLFPSRAEAAAAFAANPALASDTAFRNGTLQGAYLIVAARLLGLDCGPMSGFDAAGVDRTFFEGTNIRANFLCSLGYANDAPEPRLPRLTFDEAAQII